MIMGANIGTTVTNTLVSLGHIRQSKEFKRAFAAATVHDFFNVIAVAILLPLELAHRGRLRHRDVDQRQTRRLAPAASGRARSRNG